MVSFCRVIALQWQLRFGIALARRCHQGFWQATDNLRTRNRYRRGKNTRRTATKRSTRSTKGIIKKIKVSTPRRHPGAPQLSAHCRVTQFFASSRTWAGATEAEDETGTAEITETEAGMGTPPSEVAAAAAERFPLDRLWGHCEAQWPEDPQDRHRLLSLRRLYS